MDEKLQKLMDIISGESYPYEVGLSTSATIPNYDQTDLFKMLIDLEKQGKIKRTYDKIKNTLFWSPI